MQEEKCEKCGTINEVTENETGACKDCGTEYWWDEWCDENYEDCVTFIRWD